MKTKLLYGLTLFSMMLCMISIASADSPTVGDCWIQATKTNGSAITYGYSTIDTYINMTADNAAGGADLVAVWAEINGSYLSESIKTSVFNLSQGSNYLTFKGVNTGVGNWSVSAWVNDSAYAVGYKDCGWFDVLATTTTTVTTTTTLAPTTTTVTTTTLAVPATVSDVIGSSLYAILSFTIALAGVASAIVGLKLLKYCVDVLSGSMKKVKGGK